MGGLGGWGVVWMRPQGQAGPEGLHADSPPPSTQAAPMLEIVSCHYVHSLTRLLARLVVGAERLWPFSCW